MFYNGKFTLSPKGGKESQDACNYDQAAHALAENSFSMTKTTMIDATQRRIKFIVA